MKTFQSYLDRELPDWHKHISFIGHEKILKAADEYVQQYQPEGLFDSTIQMFADAIENNRKFNNEGIDVDDAADECFNLHKAGVGKATEILQKHISELEKSHDRCMIVINQRQEKYKEISELLKMSDTEIDSIARRQCSDGADESRDFNFLRIGFIRAVKYLQELQNAK